MDEGDNKFIPIEADDNLDLSYLKSVPKINIVDDDITHDRSLPYDHRYNRQRNILYSDFTGEACNFITVTLSPKLYKYSSITQLELTLTHLYKILLLGGRSVVVCEHTSSGNIHYHLILSASRLQSILIANKLRKQRGLGHIHIKSIASESEFNRAYEYIRKDLTTTRRLIQKNDSYIFWQI